MLLFAFTSCTFLALPAKFLLNLQQGLTLLLAVSGGLFCSRLCCFLCGITSAAFLLLRGGAPLRVRSFLRVTLLTPRTKSRKGAAASSLLFGD